MYKLNYRNIVSIQVAGVNSNDAPDFCDAYIESAKWEDNNEFLNDVELDLINLDLELIEELAQDYLQGQADYLYDMMNDR